MFLIIFLVASYYTVVSFATNDGVKLKQWFALLCWCTLPQALGIIAQLVNMVVERSALHAPGQHQPARVRQSAVDRSNGASSVQRILLGIDVTAIWSLVLQVLGYQSFTKRSYATSAAIVLGPIALIVAIGTLLALRG